MALPKISVPTFSEIIPTTSKKIKMKQMQVKDEKILLFAKESGSNGDILDAIKQVVNNCIIDDVDIDKLSIVDLEYLFIKLRANSINNMSTIIYTDPEDGKDYNIKVDLNKVIVRNETKLDNKIMISNTSCILMHYPSAETYTTKFFNNKSENELMEDMVIACIDKIADEDTVTSINDISKNELIEFIENLDIKTHLKLKEFISNMPKLEYVLEYKNSNGTERKITLSSLSDFFTFA
jgi:hypothetical protein